MKESRLDYVKKDLIWSGISNVFFTIFPFVIRTVFIRYLGSEYLGLNSLCTSIIYVLNAADFGVSNAFVYRLYKPAAENNLEEAGRLLGFYRKVYISIGVFVLSAGLLLMPFLSRLIKGDIPAGVNIYAVFFVYLINAAVSYIVLAYKELVLLANQRRDYVDMIVCFILSSMYCFQIFFVVHKNYCGYLLVMPVFTVLANLMKSIAVKKRYAGYACRGEISKECAAVFLKDVLSAAVYKFRDLSRNAFDSIIISAFAGLAPLSDYQNYYAVLLVPIVLRNILVSAVAPSMGNCIATEDKQGIFEVYKVFTFVYIYTSGWFAVCYGCLIQDFVALWLGQDFVLSGSFVLLFALYFYVLGFSDQTRMFREAAGLWRTGRVFAALEMAANLVLNICLVYFIGIEGIILATILTIVFINIPFEHYAVYHGFFRYRMKKIALFYLKPLLWFVITGTISGFLCSMVPGFGIRGILMKAVLCVLLPPALFIMHNYGSDEFKYILRRFNVNLKM